ncbi:PAS domain-containing protein [Parvularcula dongshanensis]|uniref:histidine kinase n=1 Tax=Parvularcula dongshanensis TaxID=1173995 RepID=A0A840I0H5_9PROT|nr:PAS domain-containing protein [Parvularcula dongshanensis]MBB4657610.1 PAS domain S-box-containing protein [Parvularcula dongshanensis]
MTDDYDQAERPGSARYVPRGSADGFAGASGIMFEQAMVQTRMAVCLSDPRRADMPIVFANRAFCDLTGYALEEVLGRNCRFLQGADTNPDRVAEIKDALARRDVIVTELVNYRKDGTPFWNALHLGPIYDDDGELMYFFGSQWDVTDVHAARADELHAKMMARELSHRMKNMFSVINAIVHMTGRSASSATEASEKISGRLMALGRAHEATLDSASGAELVNLGPMLATVLTPYADAERIAFAGPEVRLTSNAVSMLALTLHELSINATKYGALREDAGETGRVLLSWRIEPDPAEQGGELLILSWRERGGPLVTEAPTRTGLGGNIVTSLLHAADGQIEYEWKRAGLEATIRLPLAS